MSEEKKKKSLLGGVIKAAAVFAMMGMAVKKGVEISRRRMVRKEKENDGSPIKSYEVLMNGRELHLEEPVTELNVNVVFGGISIDLTKAQIEGELKVKASTVFGGIDMILPYGVNAVCTGGCMLGGLSSLVPEYEGDNVPTILVDYKIVLGGLNLRTEVKQDEMVKDYFDESSFQKLSEEMTETENEMNNRME